MDRPEKLSWWARIKQKYRNWKQEREFEKRYKEKLKEIKKKDPYTYD